MPDAAPRELTPLTAACAHKTRPSPAPHRTTSAARSLSSQPYRPRDSCPASHFISFVLLPAWLACCAFLHPCFHLKNSYVLRTPHRPRPHNPVIGHQSRIISQTLPIPVCRTQRPAVLRPPAFLTAARRRRLFILLSYSLDPTSSYCFVNPF